MSNFFTDKFIDLAKTRVNSEDYYGNDGLLYCGKCHEPKERLFPELMEFWSRDRIPSECRCAKAAREEREVREKIEEHRKRVEELKRRGFCDQHYAMWNWTFENDNGKCPQMKKARSYVENWETARDKNLGLLFWGNVGAGKSYAAGCIANALMEKEISVRMTNFAQILNALSDMKRDKSEYIADLCKPSLLIIDDFGMERNTEYALEQVFNVIDARDRSGKPLIITTNLTIQEIENPEDTAHSRIYSRVLKLCTPICFNGVNLRDEERKAKQKEIRSLLD